MNFSLDNLIPPEILDDSLYQDLFNIASNKYVHNILEIGSSSGEGSTKAIQEAMIKNNSEARLFCLEISKVRYDKLCSMNYERTFYFNMSSVPLESYLTGEEVFDFYCNYLEGFKRYSVDIILRWLTKDIEYIIRNRIPQNGIDHIKNKFGIEFFDMVFIDGSAFTGKAELEKVYGAGWIVLDDIVDIKNNYNHNMLQSDNNYDLMGVDYKLRYGYSLFRRKLK